MGGAGPGQRRRRRRWRPVVERETEMLPEEACELVVREESLDRPGRTSAWRGSTWRRPGAPAPAPQPSGA